MNCSIGYPENSTSNNTRKISVVHLQKLDKSNGNYNRYISSIYAKNNDSTWSKINSYTYISSNVTRLNKGTIFATLNSPKWIKPLYNPGSFDFAKYAKQKQIYQTLYINNNEDFVVLSFRKNRLLCLIDKIRNWILHTIKTNISDPAEAGLTEALLIGYKEDLDDALQDAYTASGISHIIAVSGMHMGLIFYVLTTFIGIFVSKKTSRLTGLALILPLLWAFTLVTGASPSVLRSVVVFTIMLLGNAMLKKSGSINALLASAYFLLVVQPSMLKDIGFQLSYSAVLSIIIFEPLVSKWIYVKNKMLAYVWSMIAITIAAQILTTPIVLYHFKQFPVLFLITNLIAVPLSSLVLLLTIVLCLFSLLNFPTTLLSAIIHICLTGMNTYISKIADIPFNSLPISITIGTLVLSYTLIIALTLSFTTSKSRLHTPLLIIILLLGLSHHLYRYQHLSVRQIMILHFKNETIIVHQHGGKAILHCSNRFIEDAINSRRQINQIKLNLGIAFCQIVVFENQPSLIQINELSSKKTVSVLHGMDESLEQLEQLRIDSQTNYILIADGSNKLWKIRQWEKQAHELHLRLHSTQEKGAYILPCKH